MKQLMRTVKYGLPLFVIAGTLLLMVFSRQKKIDTLAQLVGSVLTTYGLTSDIDSCSMNHTSDSKPPVVTGIPEHLAHLAHYIMLRKPLQLILVAFPFKSPNHDKKTIADLPDMAERKSLEYLQSMLNDIRKVYSPGAHLTIFCDGMPFAPFFNVTTRQVLAYEEALKKLVSDLPDITLHTSSDFITQHGLDRIEDIPPYIDRFGDTKKVPVEVLSDTMKKRLEHEFDYPGGRAFLINKSLDLPTLATQFYHRETCLRNFITKEFPASDYVRLSAHFSKNINKKFGIKLSPHSCVLPYHGVLIEKLDGCWEIRFKQEVNRKENEQHTKVINGICCPYFKQLPERKTHV